LTAIATCAGTPGRTLWLWSDEHVLPHRKALDMRTLRERAYIRFLRWRAGRALRKIKSLSVSDRESREYALRAPVRAYDKATRHKIQFTPDPDYPDWGTSTCLTCGTTVRSDGLVCPCGGCGQCDRCYGVT
jgi:hypothetical protein